MKKVKPVANRPIPKPEGMVEKHGTLYRRNSVPKDQLLSGRQRTKNRKAVARRAKAIIAQINAQQNLTDSTTVRKIVG